MVHVRRLSREKKVPTRFPFLEEWLEEEEEEGGVSTAPAAKKGEGGRAGGGCCWTRCGDEVSEGEAHQHESGCSPQILP